MFRKLCAVMTGICVVGMAGGLYACATSTTVAGGLTWSVCAVLNAIMAGDNLKDAIHGW